MPDIFISYASQHPIYVNIIEEILLQEQLIWWRDINNIRGGSDWKPEIENGIQACPVLVAIITAEAIRSKVVPYEITYAKSLHKRCIPLVFEKYKSIRVPLMKLGLDDVHAVDYGSLGLTVGNYKARECIREFTDQWKPIKASIDKLNHNSNNVRRDMIANLVATKDMRVVPHLIQALREENDPQNISYIYECLGDFPDPDVIQTLISAYSDLQDPHMLIYGNYRTSILNGLVRISKTVPTVKDLLLHWLDEYSYTTDEISKAISQTDDATRKSAIKKLLNNLKGDNSEMSVRLKNSALQGLVYFSTPALIDTVLDIAATSDLDTRQQEMFTFFISRMENNVNPSQ